MKRLLYYLILPLLWSPAPWTGADALMVNRSLEASSLARYYIDEEERL